MNLKEYILQDKIFQLEKFESWLYATNQDMKYIEIHEVIGNLKMKLFDLENILKQQRSR